MRSHSSWFGFAALVASGCSGGPKSESGSFSGAPLVTLVSAESKLVIDVRTAPSQPPERGISSVELVVRDQSHVLQEGLDVHATTWMPSMGHGASVLPTVSSAGHGTYVLDDVYLFMPGSWELRTSFSGGVTDSATAAFDIP
jgi:acetylornithine deacetylase/succinyl-diaminopimelate desuccinylase-like protein